MTKNNEQMINSIDVSECTHFIAPNGCDVDSLLMSCQCDSNPNCYFKKWQHSMKFIELLEAKIGTKDFVLKDTIKEKIELQLQLNQLKETNEGLLSIQYKLADNIKQLRQTLTKIKEIAEDTKDKFYDAIHTGGLYDRLEQIIRKIKEVE